MLEEKCSSTTQAAVVTGKQVLFPGLGRCWSSFSRPRLSPERTKGAV